jgi:hypothetical protein
MQSQIRANIELLRFIHRFKIVNYQLGNLIHIIHRSAFLLILFVKYSITCKPRCCLQKIIINVHPRCLTGISEITV